jgi:hypothetical protein
MIHRRRVLALLAAAGVRACGAPGAANAQPSAAQVLTKGLSAAERQRVLNGEFVSTILRSRTPLPSSTKAAVGCRSPFSASKPITAASSAPISRGICTTSGSPIAISRPGAQKATGRRSPRTDEDEVYRRTPSSPANSAVGNTSTTIGARTSPPRERRRPSACGSCAFVESLCRRWLDYHTRCSHLRPQQRHKKVRGYHARLPSQWSSRPGVDNGVSESRGS